MRTVIVRQALLLVGVVVVAGTLLSLVFRGPGDRAAIWTSGAVAVVLQLAAFSLGRVVGGAGSLAARMGIGALVRFLGLVTYALWRLISSALPGPDDMKARATRAGYVVSAVLYSTFAFTAFKLALTKPQKTDGNSTVKDLSTSIMRHTGGRVLVGLAGVVMIGVGVYRMYKGWKSDVLDEMHTAGMSSERRTWTRRLGSIGEIGRGVAVALIGFFLLRAAMTYNVDEATGLDGALRRAAEHTWSRVLVAIVAVGFVCYGVFCLMTFTRRRFEAPT